MAYHNACRLFNAKGHPIGIMVRVFANGLGDWGGCFKPRSSYTKDSEKWYLIPLNTQHYKVGIKGKWSNPKKGIIAIEKEPSGCP